MRVALQHSQRHLPIAEHCRDLRWVPKWHCSWDIPASRPGTQLVIYRHVSEQYHEPHTQVHHQQSQEDHVEGPRDWEWGLHIVTIAIHERLGGCSSNQAIPINRLQERHSV